MSTGLSNRGPVIAIDGPSGSGKSTIAKLLAERLRCPYIDTGAMYRALALLAERDGVAVENADARLDLLKRFGINYLQDERGVRVLLLGEDISEEIRRPGIGEAASRLSRFPEVRAALVEMQRHLAQEGPVVMEGRDIGTVVLPAADLKVFLDAEPAERTRRRLLEWRDQGLQVSAEKVRQEMVTRDERDTAREVAPLKAAPDAVRIDATALTPPQILDQILLLLSEKGLPVEG